MCMWQSQVFAGALTLGAALPAEFGTVCCARACPGSTAAASATSPAPCRNVRRSMSLIRRSSLSSVARFEFLPAIGLRVLPIRPRPQAFEPRGDVGVWPEVDIDERYDVKHRRDREIDDAERAQHVVLAGELAVEHRQETIEARLRVGNDGGVVAPLAEEGLHPPLPDQPAE